MSNANPKSGSLQRRLDTQDSSSELWSAVFARSGSLSGFCLEWLLDKAEFNDGRPT